MPFWESNGTVRSLHPLASLQETFGLGNHVCRDVMYIPERYHVLGRRPCCNEYSCIIYPIGTHHSGYQFTLTIQFSFLSDDSVLHIH